MNSFFSIKEITKREQKETPRTKISDVYSEETWEQIVKRILYLCRMKEMTLNALALRSGMTPSTLKSILYGKSKNPGIVTLRRICDGLNVSLEEFFHSKLFKEWE